MSVLDVFGRNLRVLTEARGTQAAVARDLDIGRVQFQRFLRCEAFPKPNLLDRICTYFGVDARILTEPLTECLLAEMTARRLECGKGFTRRTEWLKGLSFVAPSQDYFGGPHLLQNGIYAIWRHANSRPGQIARVLVRVFEMDGIKLVRGYDSRLVYDPPIPPAQREFRGLCLRQHQGYALLFFHAYPVQTLTTVFLAPAALGAWQREVFSGFSAVARDELPGLPRMSRVIFERQAPGCRSLVAQAHIPVYYRIEDVPVALRTILDAPLR